MGVWCESSNETHMNRTGELWESGELRYYILRRTDKDNGWHAMRIGEFYWKDSLFVILADEFFEQAWWERIA